MKKPTPRPWVSGPDSLDVIRDAELITHEIQSTVKKHGYQPTVATVGGLGQSNDQIAADAAHIVKCVNMHEALVRALRDVYDLNSDVKGPSLSEIEKLLAQAAEGSEE